MFVKSRQLWLSSSITQKYANIYNLDFLNEKVLFYFLAFYHPQQAVFQVLAHNAWGANALCAKKSPWMTSRKHFIM